MLTANMFRRTVVVGTSGSGKSTMSRQLAARLKSNHIELDSLFWSPGWTAASDDDFRNRVSETVEEESWIIDGNYHSVRELVWSRATAIVWLDLPLRVSFLRLLRRTFRRCVTGELCCNGNRESLRAALLSQDSVLFWALASHKRYIGEYSALFEEFPAASKFRLRTEEAVNSFVSSVNEAE